MPGRGEASTEQGLQKTSQDNSTMFMFQNKNRWLEPCPGQGPTPASSDCPSRAPVPGTRARPRLAVHQRHRILRCRTPCCAPGPGRPPDSPSGPRDTCPRPANRGGMTRLRARVRLRQHGTACSPLPSLPGRLPGTPTGPEPGALTSRRPPGCLLNEQPLVRQDNLGLKGWQPREKGEGCCSSQLRGVFNCRPQAADGQAGGKAGAAWAPGPRPRHCARNTRLPTVPATQGCSLCR